MTPVPMAMWSKAYVCGCLSTVIVGSNGCLLVVSVMCCQVEISAAMS